MESRSIFARLKQAAATLKKPARQYFGLFANNSLLTGALSLITGNPLQASILLMMYRVGGVLATEISSWTVKSENLTHYFELALYDHLKPAFMAYVLGDGKRAYLQGDIYSHGKLAQDTAPCLLDMELWQPFFQNHTNNSQEMVPFSCHLKQNLQPFLDLTIQSDVNGIANRDFCSAYSNFFTKISLCMINLSGSDLYWELPLGGAIVGALALAYSCRDSIKRPRSVVIEMQELPDAELPLHLPRPLLSSQIAEQEDSGDLERDRRFVLR